MIATLGLMLATAWVIWLSAVFAEHSSVAELPWFVLLAASLVYLGILIGGGL